MCLENYIVDPTDYIEEKLIGEGNFGKVLLAYFKGEYDKKIAVKEIPVNLKDRDVQKSFIREISIMANLDHPNLIEFVGFSLPTHKSKKFKIYSKFMPNNNLLSILKRDEYQNEDSKILDATKLSKIVYGIASSMAYLHQNNVVHRDLKPENVFMDENYEPILADFGLSRIYDDDITMTSRLGTPYFMAPEMFGENDEKITNKIDVYAFAVTILSLFSTKYKFNGNQPRSINQFASNIMKGKRYVIPENVPEFYASLIKRCWSNNPKERPTFDEIVDKLEESDEFILKGANVKEVHDYIEKIKNFNNSYKKKNNATTDSDDEQYESVDIVEETEEFNFDCF